MKPLLRRLSAFREIARTPDPFEQEHKLFWANRYVSRHVLHAHLDDETDAASRKRPEIQKQCRWIDQIFRQRQRIRESSVQDRHRVLDLGCGPGLYARELQADGYHVTGLDVSPASIRYARRHSVDSPDQAVYRCVDYTTVSLPETTYSLVLCIYGGMGTMSDETQSNLLTRIYRSLLPGGILIFDAFTEAYAEDEKLDTDWHYIPANGFWMRSPHMLLERSYVFETHRAFANAYTTISLSGRARRYLVWHRYYDTVELYERLKNIGYTGILHHADLSGTPWYSGSKWIGMVAIKPE